MAVVCNVIVPLG